jgi:formate-dependent nitrite reductase membrane component NrfD
VSEAEVTRDGPQRVRPGREAQTWSGPAEDGRKRKRRDPSAPRRDHPGDSYYGMPIINLPVWEEREIAGYLFTGGLAGASSLLAAGADLTGRRKLARRSKLCASAAITFSLAALVKDLGRPARFLNMLRVFKPTSPMSVGVWILVVYAPLNIASSASEVTRRLPRTGRTAGAMAGIIGPAVASYTAALLADTAVPAWHEAHRELPFLFVGSAASAAAGFGMLAVPTLESGPARRLALLAGTTELVAEFLIVQRFLRLAPLPETLHQGTAGGRLRAAKYLTAAGVLGTATLGRQHRAAAVISGVALITGSALSRFGWFAAGMQSARDPRYTVELQRARQHQTTAPRDAGTDAPHGAGSPISPHAARPARAFVKFVLDVREARFGRCQRG